MTKRVLGRRAWGALACLGFAICTSASCSSPEGSRIDPCADDLKTLCGSSCSVDADCPDLVHCDGVSKTCLAVCSPSNQNCDEGEFCSARGRCDSRIINTDGGGGTSGCPGLNVQLEKQTPTVMLLIDQSGSMTDAFGGGTRWDVLHTALVDPTTGVIARLEDEVRFGLALYTSHDGSAGGACPILTEVNIAIGNYQAIKAVYDAAQPDDETPTGESVTAVAAELSAYPEPGQKVIVLATDGEPDTCAEPNPQNGQQESIAAVQAAFQQGIFTFVISVGRDVSLGHLQDVANAGRGLAVGGNVNAEYYLADDQDQLTNAFNTIINGVRSCVFPLTGTVDPARAGEATISLDGQPLVYEDPNGWQLVGDDRVELLGSACEAVMNGEPAVSGFFPCGVINVPR